MSNVISIRSILLVAGVLAASAFSVSAQPGSWSPVRPVRVSPTEAPPSHAPVADTGWTPRLMVAAHMTVAGPVGPYALEVGLDISKFFSVRLMGGYVAGEGKEIYGSHLQDGQLGAMFTGRIPLGDRWTIRPGLGLSIGGFDGTMKYENPRWGSDEYDDEWCIFACTRDVKLDTLLWGHFEVGAQYDIADGLFLRGYFGFSMGLRGWGLNDCEDCGEQERADKTSDVFGSRFDPYVGLAMGYEFGL